MIIIETQLQNAASGAYAYKHLKHAHALKDLPGPADHIRRDHRRVAGSCHLHHDSTLAVASESDPFMHTVQFSQYRPGY